MDYKFYFFRSYFQKIQPNFLTGCSARKMQAVPHAAEAELWCDLDRCVFAFLPSSAPDKKCYFVLWWQKETSFVLLTFFCCNILNKRSLLRRLPSGHLFLAWANKIMKFIWLRNTEREKGVILTQTFELLAELKFNSGFRVFGEYLIPITRKLGSHFSSASYSNV